MQRGGLIEHWRQEFWPSADRCSETATGGSDGEIIQAISVADMQGSFYVLFFGIRKTKAYPHLNMITNTEWIFAYCIGCGLAAVSFIIERLIHRSKEKRESEVIRPYLN